MLKFTLPLNQSYTRPVLNLYNVRAVIDSGAEALIIDMTDEAVVELFGATFTEGEAEVQGIGKEKVRGKICCLKHFRIGEMEFQNIPAIIAPICDSNVDIIIGSTLFGAGCKTTIDTEANQITFEYPDKVALSKRAWKRVNGEWRILGYENGTFVTLAEID